MNKRTFRWTMMGSGPEENGWSTTGLVDVFPGEIPITKVPQVAMAETVAKLTHDGPCNGPYVVKSFAMDERE